MTPGKVYVGKKVQSFRSFGEYKPFSGVKLWKDDEKFYFAGDDSGRVLETNHRSATQSMAEGILEQIKGYIYRPYEAKGVQLDPSVECGDAVTVCGIYSVIGSMKKDLSPGGLTDISAPGGKEINHEYPYQSPRDRELKRRVKLEQQYYGAKISRRQGLVIEKIEGEDEDAVVQAKVVLNADELSFYDSDGRRVLYFDPTTGTYKFVGELNVSDKFIVTKDGNVVIKEGNISWGAVTGTEEIDQRINNAQSTADGAASSAGSANRKANAANAAMAQLVAGTYSAPESTFINGKTVKSPTIESGTLTSAVINGGEINGVNFYAGADRDTYAKMSGDGFYVYVDDVSSPKVSLKSSKDGSKVQLILGAGAPGSTDVGKFFIDKTEDFTELYLTTTAGGKVGFKLYNSGTIEPLGSLSVKATFS